MKLDQIPVPEGWILGIDTSAAQGVLRLDELVGVVSFAYHKATDGIHGVDGCWASSSQASADAGLPFGAYGVLEPGDTADVQAAHFVELVKDSAATLPPWLDFELAKGESALAALEHAVTWRDAVEDALGQRVMVYGPSMFFLELLQLGGSPAMAMAQRLATSPLALAHYTGHVNMLPRIPQPWGGWSVWQASGGHQASPKNFAQLPWGPEVDVDYFRGTVEELVALATP